MIYNLLDEDEFVKQNLKILGFGETESGFASDILQVGTLKGISNKVLSCIVVAVDVAVVNVTL